MKHLILLPGLCVFLAASLSAADIELTHGPILGRLSDDGVGIWARTSKPGEFRATYAVAMEGEPSPLEGAGMATTRLEHDNTGWVHLTGLAPNTKYRYRIQAEGGTRIVDGTFRTLPRSSDYIDEKHNPKGLFNFSFEFACGNNQHPNHGSGYLLPSFRTLTDRFADQIHFSIQNGDWLYEEMREYSPDQWRGRLNLAKEQTPQAVRHAPTITGVWENYKLYLSRGKNLAEFHRFVPCFFVFDDHEILNDVWGAGSPGLRDRRAVFRDIGTQAWLDYLGWANPMGIEQQIQFGAARLRKGSSTLVDPEAEFQKLDRDEITNLHVHWGRDDAGVNENALDGVGGVTNAGVYEIVKVLSDTRLKIRPAPSETATNAYSVGRINYWRKRIANCDFFFTDTKSEREMHDTRDPGRKGLSMLGPRQKKWLMDGVAQSDADFIFILSSVNFMVPHVGGGKVRASNKDDAWTVFFDEREQLIEAWDKLDKSVMVLSGDLHNSFVIRITDNVWEFASGPRNSNNHFFVDEGGRPMTGKFKYGPRECDIRWSTWFNNDIPRQELKHPTFCVVKVNNVFNNPKRLGDERFVAYPRPQVVFQYYDGRSGDLRYAEAVAAAD